jgi:class 3 adenylate cyclase
MKIVLSSLILLKSVPERKEFMESQNKARLVPGQEGALDTGILFVDLIDSSLFASILDLKEYAAYVESFSDLCSKQVRYFFQVFLKNKYKRGVDYSFRNIGDELVVFLHTGNNANDVYLLTVLAVTLKCAWLASPLNRQRVARRISTCEMAAGINFGPVWAKRRKSSYLLMGYAINLAKRIESISREGERFLVFLSDAAFKQINLRMRNLIFGNRKLSQAKGILGSIGIYELHDSFVDPAPRLEPDLRRGFKQQMKIAFHSNSRDLWIHSCLQVSEQAASECVTDECFALCQQVLSIDNENAVALYHLAQGYRERKKFDSARLLLEDLVKYWPVFGDGWLEYGRILRKCAFNEKADNAFARARLHGISEDEISAE